MSTICLKNFVWLNGWDAELKLRTPSPVGARIENLAIIVVNVPRNAKHYIGKYYSHEPPSVESTADINRGTISVGEMLLNVGCYVQYGKRAG